MYLTCSYSPDWFCVPLRKEGYTLGLITHIGKKGMLFGYFFKPKLKECPKYVPKDICKEQYILRGKFGDKGLQDRKWHIIEVSNTIKMDDWPMSPMIRVDKSANIAFLSHYDNITLDFLFEEKCSPDLIDQYPYDRLMGYGAVEIRLSNLVESR